MKQVLFLVCVFFLALSSTEARRKRDTIQGHAYAEETDLVKAEDDNPIEPNVDETATDETVTDETIADETIDTVDDDTTNAVDDETQEPEISYDCFSTRDCLRIAENLMCKDSIRKCVDCEGFIGGTTFKDSCGECGGDGTSCTDCNGEAYGTAENDGCGDCTGGTTGIISDAAKDDCGVCQGNNQDKDSCGVCFGNDQDKDCSGVCFGEITIDQCGVCGGTNECCKTSDEGQLCNDNGACDSTVHACACDFGWTGPLCSLSVSYCHDASGEIELIDCGEHGTCSEAQKGICICEEGYYGPGCVYKTCSGNGVYSPSIKACMCSAGFGGPECERCAVPGETRALQEMFYKLLSEELTAVAVSFGADDSVDISGNTKGLTKGLVKRGDSMVYMCIPPRIYTQKFFDSITVVGSPGNAASPTVGRLLVDYMLIPIPSNLVKPYLAGRRRIVQGLAEKPVLPNSTHEGVFFDCGCKAWPEEMIRVMEESQDEDTKWLGSPAPNALNGRSRLVRVVGQTPTWDEKSMDSSDVDEKAVITQMECVDLLDQCLDVLVSMVSAETGTADEIGKAISDGEDRRDFIQDFGLGVALALGIAAMLTMAAIFFGFYTISIMKGISMQYETIG